MNKRAIKAAQNFLTKRDYEIIDFDNELNIIVAKEDDTVVFCKVVLTEKEFPEINESVAAKERIDMEHIAMCWLSKNDYVDMKIRFDEIAMIVVGDDKAFLRHHVNYLN